MASANGFLFPSRSLDVPFNKGAMNTSSQEMPRESTPSVTELFRRYVDQAFRRTDKLFFILFGLQWIAGIVFAMTVSPRAWTGVASSIHVHVYAAVVLGGACCLVPMFFCWKFPGQTLTRHIVAIGQTAFSALLIHLTGGRIETHFHVFGSLAFLACYRDWRVLITATVVVAADHFIRGIWYPMSVYGVVISSPWRVAEHALWVVFEDVILIWSCRVSRSEMLAICEKEHQNGLILANLENIVRDRTSELEAEIVERHRSEAITRTSEERYRALVVNSPQIIMMIDRDFKIRFINRTIEGFSQEGVIGSNFIEYHPPDDQLKLGPALDDVFQYGQTRSLEVVGPGPSGSTAWYALTMAPVRNDGQVASCVVLATDITQRHQAEVELIKARDLAESGNRAKSEFLAIMSHELRTPMNAVIGFTNLLLETPLATEQKEFVQTIQTSGESLLNLINDILDISRIEAGKMDLESAPFNVREMIEEIVEVMLPRADEKGIELALWYGPNVPSQLKSDARRVRQVLLNLIGNAIKFTESGYVHVEVENDPASKTPAIRINVRDTGIGIAHDKQSLLFQKFTQVDGSSTRKFNGTGLGLAICKQLIELMGGSIGLESAPGHGSNFWFTHPVSSDVESAGDENTPSLDSLSGLRMLIVDDLEINRRVLEAQLGHWNIQFESASSGPLALEILRRGAQAGTPFHIALVDRLMPHMDAVAFADRLKTDPAIAQTALILLTSGLHRAEAPSFLKKGFARCLAKPVVRPRQLLEAVAVVWEGIPKHRRTPNSLPPVPAPEPARRPASTLAGPHVLLAEDNPVNQRVASIHLKKLGCSVDCVVNGKEAVDIVQKVRYDCVFMDVLMPEMDGLEATRRIRALSNEISRIPIIAVTANAMQGDRERCLAAGMDDYIPKPVHAAEIKRVLESRVSTPAQASTTSSLPIESI
jgi:two-component system sensor histidine kinase/response regulator